MAPILIYRDVFRPTRFEKHSGSILLDKLDGLSLQRDKQLTKDTLVEP